MIAFFNQKVGSVLMLVLADNQGARLASERKSDITRIFREDNGATVAWNFFGKEFPKNGEIQLSVKQASDLNAEINAAGFEESLKVGDGAHSNFVVGEIVEMVAHPDSDHLHICRVDVGDSERLLQIVCGAANARVGLKTVAALPISLMPNGALIFNGELRGVTSHGMLCSARELDLPNSLQVRGIIELPTSLKNGASFNAEEMWHG